VGYDREPDTMNRYATHILEDIEAGVVEGLVTNDEEMKIIPVLAAEIPTTENGGVIVRADGGMDVTWKLRPGVKWHDGSAFTADDVVFSFNRARESAVTFKLYSTQAGVARKIMISRLSSPPISQIR
jgi:peptide/nickel transport system substrate-binding protein